MIQVDGCMWPAGPTWETGAEKPDGWRARARQSAPDLIVLHWTGGEGGPEQVARTLARRGLSVHFVIDALGHVVQFEDPATVTANHAGPVNSRSIGVEIVNYAYTAHHRLPPLKGRYRPLLRARTHGHAYTHASFWPAQRVAVLALCDALTVAMPAIPRRVVAGDTLADPDDLARGGVCGHYHVSRRKYDPGPALLQEVALHWAAEEDS